MASIRENKRRAARAEQANSVRLIYTMSRTRPKTLLHCHLVNGFYFSKIPRTDERLRFVEREMQSIIRTVLFMYVFETGTKTELIDLINRGEELHEISEQDMRKTPKPLSVRVASHVLDQLFGRNFSVIVRRLVRIVVMEYMEVWRYYNVGVSVKYPSVQDFVKIYRFINVVAPTYSTPTMFINTNVHDRKIPLQNARKILN